MAGFKQHTEEKCLNQMENSLVEETVNPTVKVGVHTLKILFQTFQQPVSFLCFSLPQISSCTCVLLLNVCKYCLQISDNPCILLADGGVACPFVLHT